MPCAPRPTRRRATGCRASRPRRSRRRATKRSPPNATSSAPRRCRSRRRHPRPGSRRKSRMSARATRRASRPRRARGRSSTPNRCARSTTCSPRTSRPRRSSRTRRRPARRASCGCRTGRDKPGEVILLGAHLDSWDLGRGALDNGCNAALAIDVLRQLAVLAKAGQRPRRTIRIVLFSGEELGLYGSWQDVRAHRADLDKLRAVVIYDEGTGRTTGFSLGGRGELGPVVDRALAPVAGLGPFVHTTDAFVGTDNYDYLLEGVPHLVANQDGPP